MIPLVAVRGIRVAHGGRVALDVEALDVRPGEILAVIGPNGAGKSSLLRVIGLLMTPDAGTVRFRGEPVLPPQRLQTRRRMASVFQEPLLADATVFDNTALGLRFRGVPAAEIEPRVRRWLDRLGIGALAPRQARTLSGGEAQRTALARALVLEPELLLLDEPFSALDQPSREALIGEIGPIVRRERTSTVLVTHDRGEALALADRVAVLIGGRLLQVDDTPQVFRSPASEEVARFVGIETILDCPVLSRHADVALLRAGAGTVEVAAPAEPGEWVRLCIRPEDVTLSAGPPAGEGGSSARNHLPGRVLRVVPTGLHVRVVVDCGFPLVALVTHRSAQELPLAEGAAVTAHFKATAPHLLPGSAPRRDGGRPDGLRLSP